MSSSERVATVTTLRERLLSSNDSDFFTDMPSVYKTILSDTVEELASERGLLKLHRAAGEDAFRKSFAPQPNLPYTGPWDEMGISKAQWLELVDLASKMHIDIVDQVRHITREQGMALRDMVRNDQAVRAAYEKIGMVPLMDRIRADVAPASANDASLAFLAAIRSAPTVAPARRRPMLRHRRTTFQPIPEESESMMSDSVVSNAAAATAAAVDAAATQPRHAGVVHGRNENESDQNQTDAVSRRVRFRFDSQLPIRVHAAAKYFGLTVSEARRLFPWVFPPPPHIPLKLDGNPYPEYAANAAMLDDNIPDDVVLSPEQKAAQKRVWSHIFQTGDVLQLMSKENPHPERYRRAAQATSADSHMLSATLPPMYARLQRSENRDSSAAAAAAAAASPSGLVHTLSSGFSRSVSASMSRDPVVRVTASARLRSEYETIAVKVESGELKNWKDVFAEAGRQLAQQSRAAVPHASAAAALHAPVPSYTDQTIDLWWKAPPCTEGSKQFDQDQGVITIGRWEGADVQIPYSHHNVVSRLHAVIFCDSQSDKILIVDVGSLAGIQMEARERTDLGLVHSTPDDRRVIEIGRTEMVRLRMNGLQVVINARTCLICMDRRRNCILQPCGHFSTCKECVLNPLFSGKCPTCRAPVRRITGELAACQSMMGPRPII